MYAPPRMHSVCAFHWILPRQLTVMGGSLLRFFLIQWLLVPSVHGIIALFLYYIDRLTSVKVSL